MLGVWTNAMFLPVFLEILRNLVFRLCQSYMLLQPLYYKYYCWPFISFLKISAKFDDFVQKILCRHESRGNAQRHVFAGFSRCKIENCKIWFFSCTAPSLLISLVLCWYLWQFQPLFVATGRYVAIFLPVFHEKMRIESRTIHSVEFI